MRVVIVDDEPHARTLVAKIVGAEPDVEIVAQCGNGRDAAEAIAEQNPHLVFLDVEMPGMNGFDVLDGMPADRAPLIVFVTAFETYAVRAFETQALDYIVKPFDYDRLRETMARAREVLAARQGGSREAAGPLSTAGAESRGAVDWNRFAVRQVGRIVFLKPEEIDRLEAEGNYVRLHCGRESYLIRETMSSVQGRLGERKFLRISRSTVINLDRVKEWHPLFHGDSVVILRDGTRLTVTRVYRKRLDELVRQLG